MADHGFGGSAVHSYGCKGLYLRAKGQGAWGRGKQHYKTQVLVTEEGNGSLARGVISSKIWGSAFRFLTAAVLFSVPFFRGDIFLLEHVAAPTKKHTP